MRTGTVVEPFDDISGFWDPEASGSTVGTDNPLTTFTPSYDIFRSGSVAGRLDYVFTGETGGICRVFDTRKPVIGSNTSSSFAMWVYGDLSNNVLEFWFYSPGSINQIVYADTSRLGRMGPGFGSLQPDRGRWRLAVSQPGC